MPLPNWREEVAKLLTDSAQALLVRQERQAASKLGIALAYLEKAEIAGEAGAAEMLAKLRSMAPEQETERFQFTTGEIDDIKRRSGSGAR